MLVRGAVSLLCLAVTALAATVADAAEPDRAKTLMKEGIDEMVAGQHASACPKIEEAYRLTQGVGALFTLAECYAQWGKPATALGHYRSYLALYARLGPADRARQEERAKLANSQIATLTTLVPTLRVVLAGEDRQGATVTVDGQSVAIDELDEPLQLEVGVHQVAVTAADGRKLEQSFDLPEGVQRRWEVKLPTPETPPAPPPKAVVEEGGAGTQTAGLVVGAIGLVATAVGGITGGLALGKRSTADEHCAELVCDQEGLDAIDGGKVLGDVSTATLVIGGAALVTGIILLIAGVDDDGTEAVSLSRDGLQWRF